MDGRVAVGVPRIDSGTSVDQNPDGLQVPVPAGKVQRRIVVRQEALIDDGSGTRVSLYVGKKRATAAAVAAGDTINVNSTVFDVMARMGGGYRSLYRLNR